MRQLRFFQEAFLKTRRNGPQVSVLAKSIRSRMACSPVQARLIVMGEEAVLFISFGIAFRRWFVSLTRRL
jgi:hypothetical protein